MFIMLTFKHFNTFQLNSQFINKLPVELTESATSESATSVSERKIRAAPAEKRAPLFKKRAAPALRHYLFTIVNANKSLIFCIRSQYSFLRSLPPLRTLWEIPDSITRLLPQLQTADLSQ